MTVVGGRDADLDGRFGRDADAQFGDAGAAGIDGAPPEQAVARSRWR
jgi:hypothetical protein